MSFVRIVSGKFERDMQVTHTAPAKSSASPIHKNFSPRIARP
jgi:peptide subunit release factor RF-3